MQCAHMERCSCEMEPEGKTLATLTNYAYRYSEECAQLSPP